MTSLETVILEPNSDADFLSDIDRLCADLQVGGVAIRGFLDNELLEQIIKDDGRGFSSNEAFTGLYNNIVGHLDYGRTQYDVFETGVFTHSHSWHILEPNNAPSIRTWLHVRGETELYVARAKNFEPSGFGYDLNEVIAESVALPAVFVPEPGDVLCFIDSGCEGITGTSTFHKADVRPAKFHRKPKRISIAADVWYRPES
jgi:hypothetical protein